MPAYRLAAVIKRPRTLSAQEGVPRRRLPAIQVFGSPCNGCGIRPACSTNYDPWREWGRADFRHPHRFNLAGVLELPFGFGLDRSWRFENREPYEITKASMTTETETPTPARGSGVMRPLPGLSRLDLRLTKCSKRQDTRKPNDKRKPQAQRPIC